MNNNQALEAFEVADVDCQELLNAVDVHACCEPGVMDLYAFDFVLDQKASPTIMGCN